MSTAFNQIYIFDLFIDLFPHEILQLAYLTCHCQFTAVHTCFFPQETHLFPYFPHLLLYRELSILKCLILFQNAVMSKRANLNSVEVNIYLYHSSLDIAKISKQISSDDRGKILNLYVNQNSKSMRLSD